MAKQPARLPQELSSRLERQFGVATVRGILKSLEVGRLPTMRTNTLKATDEEVMNVLRADGVQFERVKNIPHAFKIRNLKDEELLRSRLCVEGKIYLQGISSMLPPLILDPKPGEKVLDLCAAPGSKTSQIAAMMERKGELVAFEENDIRVQKLRHTLDMQGVTEAKVIHEDATLAHKDFPEYFDKVLADVPCSAEGRIDLSDARSFGFWSEKNIVAHAKLQRRLLRSAVGCLRVGGTLVYSTCTLAPEENELMIDWLLEEFPQMKSEKFTLLVPGARQHANGSSTVLPTSEYEGFFVAKLVRKS